MSTLQVTQFVLSLFTAFCLLLPFASAEDNTLTPREQQEGWVLLFDGKTQQGWLNSDRTPPRRPVEDGALNPHGSGHYMLIHEKVWGDFILSLDFKISKGCNSGVFFRTCPLTPLPKWDVGYNGLEIAIDDTTTAGYTDTGALYDLAKPAENAMNPAGEWNHLVLTVQGPQVRVELNGKLVNDIDLSEYSQYQKRPDGSQHKFEKVIADQPAAGYIGLQDHGSDCWYKNIKLKPTAKAIETCDEVTSP